MSLFRKIFGLSKDSQDDIQNQERSKYMPEIKLPIDERFTINFKANGGKFLYCEDLDEVNQNLNSIIKENDWKSKKVLLLDERLANKFNDFDFEISKNQPFVNNFDESYTSFRLIQTSSTDSDWSFRAHDKIETFGLFGVADGTPKENVFSIFGGDVPGAGTTARQDRIMITPEGYVGIGMTYDGTKLDFPRMPFDLRRAFTVPGPEFG